jgi:hypothetical protein
MVDYQCIVFCLAFTEHPQRYIHYFFSKLLLLLSSWGLSPVAAVVLGTKSLFLTEGVGWNHYMANFFRINTYSNLSKQLL